MLKRKSQEPDRSVDFDESETGEDLDEDWDEDWDEEDMDDEEEDDSGWE